MRVHSSPVARGVPFDNSTNGFPSSATNVQSAIEAIGNANPMTNPLALFDDFDDRMAWSPSTTGTGAAASVSAGNATLASGTHNGVARVATGTVLATAAALVWSGALSNSLMVGGGGADYSALIHLPVLGSAPNHYIARIGLGTSTSADHANGIYFEYDSSASANWRLKTASSSTRTTTTSSIAVVANQWILLEWHCNAAGTSVEFFVDGVSAGTITTNIQITAGNGYGGNFQISNPANVLAAAREMFIDWFYFQKVYTTSRQP